MTSGAVVRPAAGVLPGAGWALLAAAALLASAAPLPVQLCFAGAAVGVVGMAHGAGDLGSVRPSRRSAFLLLYVAAGVAALAWWIARPAAALPAFLLASAVHFGVEDAGPDAPVERAARGMASVAAPAALHAGSYAELLRLAGGGPLLLAAVPWMATAGAASAAALLVLATRRGDARLAAGAAALLLLPPLIGFSAGFLVLHALPQTMERARRAGTAVPAYLRATAPVTAAAAALAAAAGLAVLAADPSGVRSLFAGIAALAVPHLLVTPWFEEHA